MHRVPRPDGAGTAGHSGFYGRPRERNPHLRHRNGARSEISHDASGVECAALTARALRVIQGLSDACGKTTICKRKFFQKNGACSERCPHRGRLPQQVPPVARNVRSEHRVEFRRVFGCPGRFSKAGGAGTINPRANPIEKDAGEERGSFRKPRYSGSSA